MHESEFRDHVKHLGCTKVRELALAAGHAAKMHAHDYDAHVLVMEGNMVLATAGGERALTAGDTFVVSAGTRHSERAPSMAARLLVAEMPPAQA